MLIALIANFAADRQQSMLRFGELLARRLPDCGAVVHVLRPAPVLSRFSRYSYRGGPKYLGYVDKFVLFPARLRRRLRALQPDVVHILDHGNAAYWPAAPHRRVLVTCHDLLAVRAARGEFSGQRVGWPGRLLQSRMMRALARAPAIACVSAQTRADLERLVDRRSGQTFLVPNGLNHPYQPVPAAPARAAVSAAFARVDLPAPARFLLHVGDDSWYKNRSGVLRIFAALERFAPAARELVCVGPPLSPADRRLAASLEIENRIHVLTAVSDEALGSLYSLADALLLPSWAEGFGWPVIEAQACGCPVFASNRPALPETGGDGAIYFDPGDVIAAARCIAAALPGAGELRAAGLRNAARFSAERMIARYGEIYRELAAGGPPSQKPS